MKSSTFLDPLEHIFVLLYFQKQPLLLFLAPPAYPVEFLWFKMAGTGVPHIVLLVLCSTRTSEGYFRPKKSIVSKIATFSCFGAKIGGLLTRECLVKMIFL